MEYKAKKANIYVRLLLWKMCLQKICAIEFDVAGLFFYQFKIKWIGDELTAGIGMLLFFLDSGAFETIFMSRHHSL